MVFSGKKRRTGELLPRHTKHPTSFYVASVVLLAPAIISFALFKYLPSVQAVIYSFFDYDFVAPPGSFVGLRNYVNTLSSPLFWKQMWNTLVLFFYSMVLGFMIPIFQALLLSQLKGKTKSVLKYLYILPSAIPGIASMTLWKYIWDPSYGLANAVTSALGLGEFGWLEDSSMVKITLRLNSLLGGGLGMIIYLVAIESINDAIYEAAQLDGASRTRMMFSITLPNMAGIIGIQLLLSLSGCLLAFDDILVMTDGGPGDASTTVVFGIYQKAFGDLNYGQAMATSVVLLILTLSLVAVQLSVQRRMNE
jgi:ABC transporter, permease protein